MKSTGDPMIESGLPMMPCRCRAITLPPGVIAASGHSYALTQALDGKCLTVLMDEGVFHFRLLAKYTAAFFAISSSSAFSASWRLSLAFSSANACSRSGLLLSLGAPLIELAGLQFKLSGSSGGADTVSKRQGLGLKLG
tara:strand:+ start:1575 stop:1991 length:417 start_codon:yes stop_codon:yes gene_type:complete